jgi:hypothetical protein
MTSASESAIDMYKSFIDGAVEVAKTDVYALRIRRSGHAERPNEPDLPLDDSEAARKKVLLQLNTAQREIIAKLLEECRQSATHDMFAYLECVVDSRSLKMTHNGADIALSPFETLHHDFMWRIQGYAWPQDDRG